MNLVVIHTKELVYSFYKGNKLITRVQADEPLSPYWIEEYRKHPEKI